MITPSSAYGKQGLFAISSAIQNHTTHSVYILMLHVPNSILRSKLDSDMRKEVEAILIDCGRLCKYELARSGIRGSSFYSDLTRLEYLSRSLILSLQRENGVRVEEDLQYAPHEKGL